MSTPVERRQEEMLARARSIEQRATMERLHELDRDAYPESRQGKSVVTAFQRYLDTSDAAQITAGLYAFATSGAGGLNEIAHYDIHGFRRVYEHPAKFLGLLDIERGRGIEHSSYVYTDGMTAQEVRAAIYEYADERRDEVLADFARRTQAAKLAVATQLADELGLQLTPRGGTA